MLLDEENYLAHYGILRKSGRYPWGSGGPEYASDDGFLGMVADLKKKGLSETEIASGMGITTTQLRAARSIARNAKKQSDIGMAQRLKDKGYSNTAIGERMGIRESSVRALLSPGQKDRADILQTTAAMLKDQVERKNYLDIGSGVENHIGVSGTKLNTAVAVLREEGYGVFYVKVPQLGTGKMTTIKVLAKPGVGFPEVSKNQDKIAQITDYTENGGRSFLGLQPPMNVPSSRIAVRYAKDGGSEADGVIYVRPGVEDISIGSSRYAQVRIAVDGTHYLKGMAMYKDDLPKGVDLMFNTNKNDTGNKLDAMKSLKRDNEGNLDEDNPFGAVVRQLPKLDGNGLPIPNTVRSAMNILNEEGDWDKWSRSLSAQMLSKQSPTLAKGQLNMTYERKKTELETIMKLTNPTVRKKLLESFADDTDSSAVHLNAAALPNASWHVILPFNSLKDNEIYAPNYRNGESVALIRYPHGGTFEIPVLKVNNNVKEPKASIGRSTDAVGINAKVAERLSGADFDGDAVMVIRNNTGSIKSTPGLEGLKNFDPRASYPSYEGMPVIKSSTKQKEMGSVTNLISDMTIRGASTTELARAVRHSMVVIDSEKHHLNYKQSAVDNGIKQLVAKYQAPYNDTGKGGASTLITRAGSQERVLARKPRSAAEGGPIDRETGRLMFTPTGENHVDARGNVIFKRETSKKLAETHDAHTLSSGTRIEEVYASHSNQLKNLANQARKELVATRPVPYSPSAKAAYSKEVDSLQAKLNTALKNSPLERQAQVLGNAIVSAKRDAYPDMPKEDLKKIRSQALNEARYRVGAGKIRIEITPDEWAAIQAGAISNNVLEKILNNTDIDAIKKLATPRENSVMTDSKITRATAMLNSGYTQSQVADALGVALSTLKSSVAAKDGGDSQ